MTTVMTTGTFDVLHYGHINLLKKAKEYGDFLIVGLNVTKNGKPTYYSYEERERMLEAIKYVDKVVPIYKQEDKFRWLELLEKDSYFVIGSDYIGYSDIERIKQYCNVVFIDRTPGISSTQVKEHLTEIFNTYVIDLDDTICFTKNRDFEHSKPNMPVINKMNQLYEQGFKIVIFTARGAKSCKTIEERETKYRALTEKWLKNNNVKYNELVFGKMNADYYIDDKNMSIEEFIK